jgi:hypothetical protein
MPRDDYFSGKAETYFKVIVSRCGIKFTWAKMKSDLKKGSKNTHHLCGNNFKE